MSSTAAAGIALAGLEHLKIYLECLYQTVTKRGSAPSVNMRLSYAIKDAHTIKIHRAA